MQCVLFASLLVPLAEGAGIAVFGHKVPDTDAIASAIVYAWELNERHVAATAFRLGKVTPETAYVLKVVGVEAPPLLERLEAKARVAIVDTNNPDELPEELGQASIHSIVDHHKLFGGLKSLDPMEIDMRPLCSATSILYGRAKAAGLTPPKHIAGLMLSAILSDSLGFRSPTTTDIDRLHAAELGKLAGLDVNGHADAMLAAKADIGHFSAAELVVMDSKIFKLGGKKLRVSVLETTKPAVPLGMRAKLCEAMRSNALDENLDDVILFVVDVLNEASTVVTCTPSAQKMIERAWKAPANSDGIFLLPGVLSRKKQMIPALEAAALDHEL